jgi:hypothetical protein
LGAGVGVTTTGAETTGVEGVGVGFVTGARTLGVGAGVTTTGVETTGVEGGGLGLRTGLGAVVAPLAAPVTEAVAAVEPLLLD